MTADTPAAAARALILLFRENAIPMSDRNSFLYTILEDALSAPVAAPPAASGVDALWVGKLLGYLESQMFHPSASHVPPDFRDGYNHALRAVIERVEFERTHLSTALTGAAKDTK